MLGLGSNIQGRKVGLTRPITRDAELIGYMLTSRNFEVNRNPMANLQGRSARAGFKVTRTETDMGAAGNPFRSGLWRALRLLICTCEPKRMPLTMMNFADFLHQALQPCGCRENVGASGIVVGHLNDISSDRLRSSALILALAKKGKHVIAEDGICLSCCHPATQKLLGGAQVGPDR